MNNKQLRREQLKAWSHWHKVNKARDEELDEPIHEDYEMAISVQELLDDLEIAREALEFYAERESWVTRSGRVGTSPIDLEDRDDNNPPMNDYPWAGGKFARTSLTKINGDEK